MKQVADRNKVYKSSSSNLQDFSFNNIAREGNHSAAKTAKLFWKDMLVIKESSLRARQPRERQMGVKNRHWNVRELEEKLSDVKYATIKNFSDL